MMHLARQCTRLKGDDKEKGGWRISTNAQLFTTTRAEPDVAIAEKVHTIHRLVLQELEHEVRCTRDS